MYRCAPSILLALSLNLLVPGFGATLTVNTTSTDEARNDVLSFTEAIRIANGELRPADTTVAEQAQISGTVGTNDRIAFAIPGDGPHLILRPFGSPPSGGGFPAITAPGLTLDGYSQAGARPNSNPILAPNNAILKIVLDARDSIPDPEEDRLLSIQADQVTVRGLSLLSSIPGTLFTDGSSALNGTCWGLVFASGAVGGQVAGCWIGLHPDGQTVAGSAQGVEAYGSGGSQVIGTNGDGVDDRAEFNVIVGHDVHIQIDYDDTADPPVESHQVRISGNFIGVMPNGVSTIPEDVLNSIGEGDAIEGARCDGLLVGTNADGVADEDERNIIGGMRQDAFEFWDGANTGLRICGNYIGVGVDGTTPVPNARGFQTSWHGHCQAQFGSDLDGVRDALEANRIAHCDAKWVLRYGDYEAPQTLVTFRGNQLIGNAGPIQDRLFNTLHNFLLLGTDGVQNRIVADNIAPVLSATTTRNSLVGSVPVSGSDFAFPGVSTALIDLYVADPDTASTAPQGRTWVASFVENGSDDLDPNPLSFHFDLTNISIPGSGTVSLVLASTIDSQGAVETGVFSNLVAVELPAARPTLRIQLVGSQIELSWDDPAYGLQVASSLEATPSWTSLSGVSPLLVDIQPPARFYRLVQ